jgi:hypothetical protein
MKWAVITFIDGVACIERGFYELWSIKIEVMLKYCVG